MSEHAEGPWRYGHPAGKHGLAYFNIYAPSRSVAAKVCSEADARLIAAAPEMLEALNDACLALTKNASEEFRQHAFQAIQAAIAKAAGATP